MDKAEKLQSIRDWLTRSKGKDPFESQAHATASFLLTLLDSALVALDEKFDGCYNHCWTYTVPPIGSELCREIALLPNPCSRCKVFVEILGSKAPKFHSKESV